jgi:hypothetical protein
MLSSVLNSQRAVQVNIEIMRAFVRLRGAVSTHKGLGRQLITMESRYDRQFKVVFDAIRGLMKEPESKRRGIGFTNRQLERPEDLPGAIGSASTSRRSQAVSKRSAM